MKIPNKETQKAIYDVDNDIDTTTETFEEFNLSVKMALCSSGYMSEDKEKEIIDDLSNMSENDLKISEIIKL